MSNPIPLLILSDSPMGSSGLGRICRELAVRIHANLPEFRVGVIGYGGSVSRHLGFQQYPMVVRDFMPLNLPDVWKDFAGDERGICLCIWNQSWLPWMGNPERCVDESLKKFLLTNPFERWLYTPIDGDTIDGRLPQNLGKCMAGFDRLLAYTKYGADVCDLTFRRPLGTTEHLPHGIDCSIWYPRDRKVARDTFTNRVAGLKMNPLKDDIFLVGILGTNSARKNWFLGLEVCRELVARGVNLGLWLHPDSLRKNWDLPQLIEEFGLTDKTIASNRILSDDDLAFGYSACDATLGIAREGFGYALAESLACGTPVITGRYAAATDYVPSQFMVEPIGYHGEGFFGVRDASYRASDWADVVMAAKREDAILPTYLQWDVAFDGWAKWLRAGLADLNANPVDRVTATFGVKP